MRMDKTISIIIPTSGTRNDLLTRAIQSTITNKYNIEIIIVVNGSNAKNFDLPTDNYPGSIHIERIDTPGVSNARNIGISLANGSLIRFLDDDDFLIPEAAERQYDYAFRTNADIVSSKIMIQDQNRNKYDVTPDICGSDIYCILLSAEMPVLPHAHIYKTSVIKSVCWDISMNNAEDADWLHRVIRDSELKWLAFNEVVGIWFQHPDPNRLSFTSINNQATKVSAEAIKFTFSKLKNQGRLNKERVSATARGLWNCAHKAFYLSPVYWTKIVKLSLSLDNTVFLNYKIYRIASKLNIHPLALDWLVIPKRHLNHLVRAVSRFLRRTAHIRRL